MIMRLEDRDSQQSSTHRTEMTLGDCRWDPWLLLETDWVTRYRRTRVRDRERQARSRIPHCCRWEIETIVARL